MFIGRLFYLVIVIGVCLVSTPSLAQVYINTADADELITIKGIGPKTAEKILEERARGGRFLNFEDLGMRVKGFGEKRIAKLKQEKISFKEVNESNADKKKNSASKQPETNKSDSKSVVAQEVKQSKTTVSPTRNTSKKAIRESKQLYRPKYVDGPYFVKPPPKTPR